MPNRTAGLRVAAEHAESFLATLDERPVAARVDAAGVRELSAGRWPSTARIPRRSSSARRRRRAGPRRHRGPAPLRLRHRRRPARRPGRRLAGRPHGTSARRSTRSPPRPPRSRRSPRRGRSTCWASPPSASVGFVTGGQGANTTCLAAARHAVLARAGWDVERDGLIGAPRVARARAAIRRTRRSTRALRLLGLGAETADPDPRRRPGPDGRRRPPEGALAGRDGPTIVCAQAGNVATGAFDAFEPIADACPGARRLAARRRRLWIVGRSGAARPGT